MRDALGGTVTLVIIVVFIVIALGYTAFNVNYTKAFRMKDKIISVYEDFDGECNSKCRTVIRKYAKTLGYSTDRNLHCPDGFQQEDDIYCWRKYTANEKHSSSGFNIVDDSNVLQDISEKNYYRIITKINLQIPIISNVFDFQFFYIKGDTKAFEVRD